MKVWRIETTVESEDEYDEKQIFAQIDRDLNRGDGIYMKVGSRDKSARLTLIRTVKEQ